MYLNKQAFTLIELLVIVLIIGVLAAVAVPQYQKAVQKARFAEWKLTMNLLMKAIDLYVLENGYPSATVYFLGTDAKQSLDMDFSGTNCTAYTCENGAGKWRSYCGTTNCRISFNFIQDSKLNPNPPQKATPAVILKQVNIQNWSLEYMGEDYLSTDTKRIICQFAADNSVAGGYYKPMCSSLGIVLR
ncbi:MAG: prepilin-type N-terminal cleavage/methylation domain-containing protein [Elusimicrobiaceae bacterium]|nr:prepilin-type N-terminal cleavage/methylation domain-containing protein [Elusimicrobiaceae bacterium]